MRSDFGEIQSGCIQTKSPRGRMHAEKHRTALPGQAGSCPGVIPGKAFETAQRPADGARKLQATRQQASKSGARKLPPNLDPRMGHESYHLRETPHLGHRHCLESLTRQKRERGGGLCPVRAFTREKYSQHAKNCPKPPLLPWGCVHFRCGNILPPREKLSEATSSATGVCSLSACALRPASGGAV